MANPPNDKEREEAAKREAARDKERDWDRQAEAKREAERSAAYPHPGQPPTAAEKGVIGKSREARDLPPDPPEAAEPGYVYDTWRLDSAGQADLFCGTTSGFAESRSMALASGVQQPEQQADSVWVVEPPYQFYVDGDGLVLYLVEKRALGSPFQDRLYAARGERAAPGGLVPVETPTARAPSPSVESLATAREKKATKTKDAPKTGLDPQVMRKDQAHL